MKQVLICAGDAIVSQWMEIIQLQLDGQGEKTFSRTWVRGTCVCDGMDGWKGINSEHEANTWDKIKSTDGPRDCVSSPFFNTKINRCI